MSIVVEDGTGVAGAETYATVAMLRAWTGGRGVSIPAAGPDGDTTCEQLLRKAADWLQVKDWSGKAFSSAQGLAFPRASSDPAVPAIIPIVVPIAQMMLAIEAQNGALFSPARPGKYEKVKADAVFVTFTNAATRAAGLQYTAVDRMLQPYYAAIGAFATVRA